MKHLVGLFLAVFIMASAASAQTVADTLTTMRAPFDVELSNNYSVLRKFVFLTDEAVGSQGEEAQQAFVEMVMNQAVAKKWSLNRVMNKKYFPQLKQEIVDLPISVHRKYVNLIDNALEGSNVALFMTDSASGKLASKRKMAGRHGVDVGNEFFYVDLGHMPFFREMDKMFRDIEREFNPDRRRPVNPKVKPVKKDEDKKDDDKGKKDDKVAPVVPSVAPEKPVEVVPAPVVAPVAPVVVPTPVAPVKPVTEPTQPPPAPVAPPVVAPPAPTPPPVEDTGWSDWFKSMKNKIEDAIKK